MRKAINMMKVIMKDKSIFLLSLRASNSSSMLSNACKYAIRAVIYLAIHSDAENKLGAKKIANGLEVPQAFLAQMLQKLSADKIIASSKGPGGGFYIDTPNKEHTLWDVILSIDGPYRFDDCFLGLAKCDNINPCPVHDIVAPFKKEILSTFKDKSLEALASEIRSKGTVISLKGFDLLD